MNKGLLGTAILLLVISVLTGEACAQWTVNGIAVCTDVQDQREPCIISDQNGGSIIAWIDDRQVSPSEVYAQRIDRFGQEMWASDGIPVYSGTYSASIMYMTDDGSGGAYLAVYTLDSLYIQHLYPDGTTWDPPTGIGICTTVFAGLDPEYVSLTSVGESGVIVSWQDSRTFPTLTIYAQRLDPAGEVEWTAGGELICTGIGFRMSPSIAPDQSGGAIVTWADERSGVGDIYAQRIDSTGTVLWTGNGAGICIDIINRQSRPQIVSDGAGGAIIAWEDERGSYTDVYLQKLDAGGTPQWTANGVAASTAFGPQEGIRLITDGEGGAIAAWLDNRNGLPNTDIYAQRVDTDGVVLWETDGTPICADEGTQGWPDMSEDGAGGAIITWLDTRDSNDDIYAQRIDSGGNVIWSQDGHIVCSGEPNVRGDIAIAFSDPYGAVIAWEDARSGFPNDIYAQSIDLQGNWGYRAPTIYSIEDVPGDQGGFVNLFWYSSVWEEMSPVNVTHYTLWRAVEPLQAAAVIETGAVLIENPAELELGKTGRVLRRTVSETATYFWELVGTQDAYLFEAYAMAIPTLFDSTSEYHAYHYFQVLAHLSDESYYTSGVDSAYSVDNLPPAVPMGLAGEQSYQPTGLQLSWNENGEEDLAAYNVYRGTDGGFTPGPGNWITSTADPNVFDDEWTWDSGYWYKVAAVDIHGNESGYSTMGPSEVTGDDPAPIPDATFLSQNYPNPFNPATTIEFGLKVKGHVSLRIYDAAGRLVEVLVDETRPAGRHTAEWGGRGADGSAAASGVYFYKLKTDGFEETKKMIMLR
jgi:hypothetical protein